MRQLTSSLQKTQEYLETAQNKINQMTRESTTLSDDVRQHKLALNESQLQRTQLNNIIAKMAKEKGDLVREKVSLRVQVGTLEDSLSLLKKKQVQVSQERNRLEQRMKDMEKRLFLDELNKSLEAQLASSSSINRRSSFDLPSKVDDVDGNGENASLQDTVALLKKKELELQSGLEVCRNEYEVQLMEVKETHSSIMSSLRGQHESAYNSWRTEMDTLRSSQWEQLSKMQAMLRERDSMVEAMRQSKELSEVECDKLRRELTSVRNEMEKLRQELAQSDERLFTQSLPHSEETCDEQRLQVKSKPVPDPSLLTEQLESFRDKFQQVQKEITFLKENNRLLQSGREELEAAVTKAEMKSLMLQNSLTSQIENSDQYQRQIKTLGRETDEQKRQQQLRDKETRKQLMELETKLSLLQMQHEELQKEKRRIELRLHDLQKNNTSTEHELLALKADNSSLVSKLKTSEGRYRDMRTEHSQMLEALQQVVECADDTYLHSFDSSSLAVPVSSTMTRPRDTPESLPQLALTPQAALQSLLKLKREIDSLKKKDQQQVEKLEQKKRDIHRSHEEKAVSEARIQTLQSSLASLQTSFDSISRQRNKAEATAKEAKKTVCELQTGRKELQREISNLQQQLQSCRTMKRSMEKQHRELEQKMRKLRIENSSHVEQVSNLKCEVSHLQSSHLVKDRQLVLLEDKHRKSPKQIISSEGTKKSKGEELSAQQELVEKELQTLMQPLSSQLTESQRKVQGLREENTSLQKEVLTLTKEVEQLRQCLRTTTAEKQRLSQSQEKEINRLRKEVERYLQLCSGLKVKLLRYRGQPLMSTPVSSVAAKLTPVKEMQSKE